LTIRRQARYALAQGFDLQGHRGARGLWPENTLAGFARTLAIGVTTLELDCAVTRDGVVVISHDPRLNPAHTRDDRGQFIPTPGPAIFSLSYRELRRYDVGRLRPGTDYAARFPHQQPVDGERIPRLADLFALVRRVDAHEVRFNIETKIFPLEPELTVGPEQFATALVRVVMDAGMEARTLIQSFDWRTLQVVHRIAPMLGTVALTDEQPGDDTIQFDGSVPSPWLGGLDAREFGRSVPSLVAASGANVWSPDQLDVDAARVAEAKTLGLAIVPWTANEPADMHRMLDLGVDGLISDRPDVLRDVLRSRGRAVPAPVPPG
jgi:glycerophosphoryl diester phosphodiesterase